LLYRTIYVCAGILPEALITRMQNIFPNLLVLGSPFGSTETGILTEPNALDCMGALIGSTTAKVTKLEWILNFNMFFCLAQWLCMSMHQLLERKQGTYFALSLAGY